MSIGVENCTPVSILRIGISDVAAAPAVSSVNA
jgi:hypothetical protein